MGYNTISNNYGNHAKQKTTGTGIQSQLTTQNLSIDYTKGQKNHFSGVESKKVVAKNQ
jgi:hypothetical protein